GFALTKPSPEAPEDKEGWAHVGEARQKIAYLLYDANCGPCTSFKDLVRNLDLMHRMIPLPLQSKLAYELVRNRVTKEEMMRSFHIVYIRDHPTGKGEGNAIFSGGNALIQLIRLLPLGFILYPLWRFKSLRRFIWWIYLRVSQLR